MIEQFSQAVNSIGETWEKVLIHKQSLLNQFARDLVGPFLMEYEYDCMAFSTIGNNCIYKDETGSGTIYGLTADETQKANAYDIIYRFWSDPIRKWFPRVVVRVNRHQSGHTISLVVGISDYLNRDLEKSYMEPGETLESYAQKYHGKGVGIFQWTIDSEE